MARGRGNTPVIVKTLILRSTLRVEKSEATVEVQEELHCVSFRLDPVTGGLSKDGPSPLDGMTEEEKEQEAEKLHSLMQKLNAYAL